MDTNEKAAIRVVEAYLKNAETQLEKGKKVEEEHEDVYDYFEKFLKKHDLEMPLDRKKFYEMIAKSHIAELKDYYTKLEKIESHHKEAMDFTSIAPLLTPDRKLTDNEIARALRLSISAELDAVHTYELIADAVKDKKVQAVMKSVADEEKIHAGEFEHLLKEFDPTYEESLKKGKSEVNKLTK